MALVSSFDTCTAELTCTTLFFVANISVELSPVTLIFKCGGIWVQFKGGNKTRAGAINIPTLCAGMHAALAVSVRT